MERLGSGDGWLLSVRSMRHDDALPRSLDAGSTIRQLTDGEVLFRQGDSASAIYRVESGRLRLVRRTVDDHLVVLHTARAGEFFAEAALFSEAYHCDAVAAAPSCIRVYSKSALIAALRGDPALSEAFMASFARQLQELRARMELRNIRSARERVLQYLRLRAEPDRRRVLLEGRLQDVAAEVGMTSRGPLSHAGVARSRRHHRARRCRDHAE